MQYAGFRHMIFSFEEHMPPPRWGKLGSSRDRDHKRIRSIQICVNRKIKERKYSFIRVQYVPLPYK